MASASKKNPRASGRICEYMTFAGREAFKRLRTNVMIALEDGQSQEKHCRVIGVTSAQPSEGKSTVSLNLAFTIAEMGKSVILIDCDLRRPSIHTAVGVEHTPGLSEVLTGEAELQEVITSYKSSREDARFEMILSGDYPDNPSELLNSNRFHKLIEVLSSAYDYVVIDLPPVNAVVDAVTVSQCTDGLIVVIRENHCPRGVLAGCVDQLTYAKARILGFVLNGCVGGSGKKYQYNQQSYSHYGK